MSHTSLTSGQHSVRHFCPTTGQSPTRSDRPGIATRPRLLRFHLRLTYVLPPSPARRRTDHSRSLDLSATLGYGMVARSAERAHDKRWGTIANRRETLSIMQVFGIL